MVKPDPVLCACGCGDPAPIAKQTIRRLGYVKGQPVRFRRGHSNRKSGVEFIVDPVTGCWEWQRAKNERGYGITTVGGRTCKAHRVVFERGTGQVIPPGMVPDHTCDNKGCVNPDHIEVVTQSVNVRRGFARRRARVA